jgi:hypothetical protein
MELVATALVLAAVLVTARTVYLDGYRRIPKR